MVAYGDANRNEAESLPHAAETLGVQPSGLVFQASTGFQHVVTQVYTSYTDIRYMKI